MLEGDGRLLAYRTTGGARDTPARDTHGARASTYRRTTGGALTSALLAGDRLVLETGAPAGAPRSHAARILRRPTTDSAHGTNNHGVAEA
jgi:hypothetical protein